MELVYHSFASITIGGFNFKQLLIFESTGVKKMSNLSNGNIVVAPFKSSLAAILLSLVLGPVGLLYVNWVHSIIMLVITLIIFSVGIPQQYALVLGLLVWVVCVYWTGIDVLVYNKRLLKQLYKDE
ncbi:MAG: hypothetical protein A3E87_00765 [Gammaproteobacteria bacterium RIFCSPHIGHO2_12_FULL_35_23]|nr:MAG: hypothetical protein A3E87_00765 [Gammaproteobacteria bacterium RIFCSPHIGHO2_12_FULL_35_23]